MSLKNEQIEPDSYDRQQARRKLQKKNKTRLERRAAKKDPENAPKKRTYKGYDS